MAQVCTTNYFKKGWLGVRGSNLNCECGGYLKLANKEPILAGSVSRVFECKVYICDKCNKVIVGGGQT